MSIRIRSAEATDQAPCLDLLTALSAATGGDMSDRAEQIFSAFLDGARGQLLVADEDGHLLGMASCSYNIALRYGGEYCQLEELVVSPAARGKNIGAQLMEAAVAAAQRRGCAEFGLYLVASTEHNRAFYEKFGFTAVGTEMRRALT